MSRIKAGVEYPLDNWDLDIAFKYPSVYCISAAAVTSRNSVIISTISKVFYGKQHNSKNMQRCISRVLSEPLLLRWPHSMASLDPSTPSDPTPISPCLPLILPLPLQKKKKKKQLSLLNPIMSKCWCKD